VIDFGFEEQLRRIVNDSHMPPPSKRRTTVSVGCPLPASEKAPLQGLLQVRRATRGWLARVLFSRQAADGEIISHARLRMVNLHLTQGCGC
jgi:hypothetical protein